MTPDQEKELQKAAEGYAEDDRGQEEIWSVYKLVREAFIAGAKHQDAISRKDEREKLITLFQDKADMLEIYSTEWDMLRNLIKQATGESK